MKKLILALGICLSFLAVVPSNTLANETTDEKLVNELAQAALTKSPKKYQKEYQAVASDLYHKYRFQLNRLAEKENIPIDMYWVKTTLLLKENPEVKSLHLVRQQLCAFAGANLVKEVELRIPRTGLYSVSRDKEFTHQDLLYEEYGITGSF
jgi:hypothetical protein